jgi:hypothetical protein
LDNPQPSPKGHLKKPTDAVQRLDGGRFQNVSMSLELKIESGPPEMEPWDERPNQPGAQGDLCLHGGRGDRTTGITGLWQPSVHSDVAF